MYITEQYKKLNRDAHVEQSKYGAKGGRRQKLVRDVFKKYACTTALDYGCGKGDLARTVNEIEWQEFDPAIPGKDMMPNSADLVVCGDVMEHIEPKFVQQVTNHICELADKVAVVIISLRQGKRKLPDGSFAHKIVRPAHWWMDLFTAHADAHEKTVNILSVDKKELILIIKA